MSKPFIVVDTNIFISAVLLNSKNVVLALEKARYKFRILSSEKTFEELVRNFYKPKFAKYAKYHDIATELRDIADSLYFIETTIKINDCRHEKDNKFLELAISGNAQVILSGDNDLLSMHPWRGILIVNPFDFILLQ